MIRTVKYEGGFLCEKTNYFYGDVIYSIPSKRKVIEMKMQNLGRKEK